MIAQTAPMLSAYNTVALGSFFFLQAMDFFTSAVGGRLGLTEMNPILATLVEEYGFSLAVGTAKAAACALIFAFWGLCPSSWLRAIVLTAICLAYTQVVLGNISAISAIY